jgi:Cu/Ag efflux protein CusF
MALTKLLIDVQNVIKLDDLPNDVTGLTPAEFKAKFDKAPQDIKDFINNTLIPQLEAQYATIEALQQVIAGQINTVDPVTGKKYVIAIENGELGVKEV